MLNSIIIYTAIMLLGIYLGKKGFLKKILKNNTDRVFTALLMTLLFIMGLNFGKNPNVIHSLTKLGYKAFLMAFAIIISATLFVYIGNKVYDKIIGRNK